MRYYSLKLFSQYGAGLLIFVPIVTKIRKGWTLILFPSTLTRSESELMIAVFVSNSIKSVISDKQTNCGRLFAGMKINVYEFVCILEIFINSVSF